VETDLTRTTTNSTNNNEQWREDLKRFFREFRETWRGLLGNNCRRIEGRSVTTGPEIPDDPETPQLPSERIVTD